MPKTIDYHDVAESPDRTVEGSPDAHRSRLSDKRRLHALKRAGLQGGVANPVLDCVARLTAGIVGVPIAVVSLVDDRRQPFAGLAGPDGLAGTQRGTTLSHSFCQYVVTRDAALMDVRPVPWTAVQIARLKEQSRYTALAERDTLTGVRSRQGFAASSRARHALAQQEGTPFSIVSVSLNGFRRINAEHGDDAGAHALIDIAALLSTSVQTGDIVAHTGRDEFTLMIAGPHDAPHADLESAITSALAVLNAEIGREHALKASVGVAHWSPDVSQALATAMQCADDAMAQQKRHRHTVRAA